MTWVLLGWNTRCQNELMIFKTDEVVQKLVGKGIMIRRIFVVSKYLSTRFLLITKRKTVPL